MNPILKLLTLPRAIVTLGIAWFGVAMLIVGKFDIHGFWNLVGATIIVWVVNLVLDLVIFRDRGPISV